MSTQEIALHAAGGLAQTVSAFMPAMTMGQAIERRNIIIEATTNLMKDGVDYGVVPGTGGKPCLLQPGADKLCNLFGLSIQYEFIEKAEDWTGRDHGGEPFFYYQVKGRAYRGDYLVGEGIGSCSSWESKYRYRKAERTCPVCGVAAIIVGKPEYGGGYVCFHKKGGCGAKFQNGAPEIESQEVGRRPNPDIADQVNTVLKIAVKRCKVATVINATSASEFFTQDMEDFPPEAPRQEIAEAMNERFSHAPDSSFPPPPPTPPPPPPAAQSKHAPRTWRDLDKDKPWATRGQMVTAFNLLANAFGKGDELEYVKFLDDAGAKRPEDFKTKEAAITCFQQMRRWLVGRDGEAAL